MCIPDNFSVITKTGICDNHDYIGGPTVRATSNISRILKDDINNPLLHSTFRDRAEFSSPGRETARSWSGGEDETHSVSGMLLLFVRLPFFTLIIVLEYKADNGWALTGGLVRWRFTVSDGCASALRRR